MGVWMVTALVIGNMIGSGIFLLPATMAGEAGPVSILAWVFTGIGAIVVVAYERNVETNTRLRHEGSR